MDTAVIVPVNIMRLLDDTDFKSIETAVVYNSAGLDLTWHFQTPAGVVTGTAVTPTTGGVYDWSEPIADKGMYAIEIPASGGASINNDTEGVGWFTGVATGVLSWRGPTIGFRRAALNDLFIEGSTASTNMEDFFDGTGYAGGTAKLTVDAVAISGDTTAADNCELMFDGTGYAGGTARLKVDVDTIKTQAITCAAGVTVLASVGTAATSTAQTGDSYALANGASGFVAIKGIVDTIQADTDLLDDVSGGLADIHTDVAAVKTDTAAILVDTGTTLDARIPSALTANGNMKCSLVEILTTALTETAGLLAGGFKKFFNVAAPTATCLSLPDAVPGAAGGVFIAGTNAATTVTTALTTTFTGNLTGSVASVSGSVGSVSTGVTLANGAHGGAAASMNLASGLTANITGNLSGSVGSVSGAVGSVTGAVGSVAAGVTLADGAVTAAAIADGAIDNAAFAADVGSTAIATNVIGIAAKKGIVDALNVDTYAEPGQEAPAATNTLVKKIGYLFKAWRNKSTQTATTYSLFADDTTTVDQKSTVTDDGTTLTRGEIATGP